MDPLSASEAKLRRALQAVQSTQCLAEAGDIYKDAAQSVGATLQALGLEERSSAARGLMALLVYVHLAYRTKLADVSQTPRVIAVR